MYNLKGGKAMAVLTALGLLLVIGALLHRIIIRIVQGIVLAIGAGALGLIAIGLDDRLTRAEYVWYPIIGAGAGFLFLVGGGSIWIRHALIRFYLRRTIQRDRDAAQAGKLW